MDEPIQYKQGRMVKDPVQMNPAEKTAWHNQCAKNARHYLFSIGQPLVYKRQDGHRVAEYSDGRVEVVR